MPLGREPCRLTDAALALLHAPCVRQATHNLQTTAMFVRWMWLAHNGRAGSEIHNLDMDQIVAVYLDGDAEHRSRVLKSIGRKLRSHEQHR